MQTVKTNYPAPQGRGVLPVAHDAKAQPGCEPSGELKGGNRVDHCCPTCPSLSGRCSKPGRVPCTFCGAPLAFRR